MKKILIIGAGAMGSAFSLPCIENNNHVSIVGTHLEKKFIKNLKKNYYHKTLKSYLPRKVKILDYQNLIDELRNRPDYVVIAVSSKGIDWVCKELIKNYDKKLSLILLTKGLVNYNNKMLTISEKINKLFQKNGLPKQDITSIKGPCLAAGLINKIRTSTVIANRNIVSAKKVERVITTKYYKAETSKDIIGIEVLSAIKNLYAMLIGASLGLSGPNIRRNIRNKYYHNTSSSLFRESLLEMKNFTVKMNGLQETTYGLAGLGDLYVSVAGGRNSKMGYYLGLGKKYQNIKRIEMKSITTEGCELAIEIGPIIKKKFKRIQFPILFALIDAICKNQKLKIKW